MCRLLWLCLFLSGPLLNALAASDFNAIFQFNGNHSNKVIQLIEEDVKEISFQLIDDSRDAVRYEIVIDEKHIANISGNSSIILEPNQNGTFTIVGKFLGRARVYINRTNADKTVDKSNTLGVTVLLKDRKMTHIFTGILVILVCINYIFMGCTLDLTIVKKVIVRPIGPVVGIVCQYVGMPLIAFGAAKLIFTDHVLQLGLFIFGCCPSGGASNTWTVLLKGNLNLSITMTFISTLASLAMIPFWLFVLGKHLWKDTQTVVPYANIFYLLIGMIVPLLIGLAIQRYLPRVANWGRKALVPFSICMLIFIIGFGTYANLYMFKLMTMNMAYAASINVWVGFLVAMIVGFAFRLPIADVIAIIVETGIQNTGIAYVLISLCLPEPDSSIAKVVPIVGSIVTPIPLTIAYIILLLRNYFQKKKNPEKDGIVKETLVHSNGSMDETKITC